MDENKQIDVVDNDDIISRYVAYERALQETKDYIMENHIIPEDIMYSHLTKAERNAIIEPVRTTPKINNNSLCSCGSGLKYKKCCKK